MFLASLLLAAALMTTAPTPPLVTPFERDPAHNTTATYAECVAFYKDLAAAYPATVQLHAAGPTDSGPIPAQNQSWVNRVADIDQTGRVAGGLPNTCSPIGNGGQTGCSVQAAKQWAAEKRAQRRAESSIP